MDRLQTPPIVRANAVRGRRALQRAAKLRAQCLRKETRAEIGRAWDDRKLMWLVTLHWFRHLLAIVMMALRVPVCVGMEQGG